MRENAAKASYNQPGDPVKLATAIVRLAASPKPPVHLPLGNDTLKHYREKSEAFEKEIAEWHESSPAPTMTTSSPIDREDL